MKKAACAALMLMLLAFAGAPTSAHHSFAAAYDTTKTITVQGTIVQVRLTNPHSWFFLDVKEPDGKLTRWSFEAGTPSGMIRGGYNKNELGPGAVVTIRGCPARDTTKNVGMLQQLTTADGKTYGMFGPQEGPGAR